MPFEEKWIIFVLIVVLVIFGLQYKKQGGFGGPALSPQNRGGIYDFLFPKGNEKIQNVNPEASRSTYGNPAAVSNQPKLSLSSSAAKSQIPKEEYIVLQNTGSGSIAISGLKLKNKKNEEIAIPGDENGNTISLAGGEGAVLSTGFSPRGFNFKINKCSGYFNKSQNFIPEISTFCPYVRDLPQVKNLSDDCNNFIDRIQSCQTPAINLNSGIDNNCAEFVSQHASYTGCVADHQNDKDFDQDEWRIYLNRSQEFWGNLHETIQLIDSSGKVVAETSY